MQILDFPSLEFTIPNEGITLEYKTASFSLPKNFWDSYSV